MDAMTETTGTAAATPAGGGRHAGKEPLIAVNDLWKVFGPDAEKIVGSPDAALPRTELRAQDRLHRGRPRRLVRRGARARSSSSWACPARASRPWSAA